MNQTLRVWLISCCPVGTKRRDAENGHRDGRAPRPSPSRAANGSFRWTNGGKVDVKLRMGFVRDGKAVEGDRTPGRWRVDW